MFVCVNAIRTSANTMKRVVTLHHLPSANSDGILTRCVLVYFFILLTSHSSSAKEENFDELLHLVADCAGLIRTVSEGQIDVKALLDIGAIDLTDHVSAKY